MTETVMQRGRLSVPDRNTGREFMYNPGNLTHAYTANFGSSAVAGASHPQYQYAGGGDETFSFELYLDGDRARAARGVTKNAYGQSPLDISDEIDFLQSLQLPTRYGGTRISSVFPGIVLFSFGTAWVGVPCIVPHTSVKYEHWIPDPARKLKPMPVKATVSLSLTHVPRQSITAAERWPDDMGVH